MVLHVLPTRRRAAAGTHLRISMDACPVESPSRDVKTCSLMPNLLARSLVLESMNMLLLSRLFVRRGFVDRGAWAAANLLAAGLDITAGKRRATQNLPEPRWGNESERKRNVSHKRLQGDASSVRPIDLTCASVPDRILRRMCRQHVPRGKSGLTQNPVKIYHEFDETR